jgi:hypothetical protein
MKRFLICTALGLLGLGLLAGSSPACPGAIDPATLPPGAAVLPPLPPGYGVVPPPIERVQLTPILLPHRPIPRATPVIPIPPPRPERRR